MSNYMKKIGRAIARFLFPRQLELHDLKKKYEEKWSSYEYYFQMNESDYPFALSNLYFQKMGLKIDLNNPITYTEKIQWRKLYENNPLLSLCADKYAVRHWVAERLGERYLVPLIGRWDNPEEIDFNSLPKQFVLKINNSSGSNIVVKDKDMIDIKVVKEKLRFMLKEPAWFRNGFEMHYQSIQPQIIAEEYISELDENLYDYKFFCFGGRPQFIQCVGNRSIEEGIAYDANFDLEWNRLDWTFEHSIPYSTNTVIPKPPHFDELKECATVLSQEFDFVRVDLYDIIGKGVLFGEMTFTPGSGFRIYKKTWTRERDIWLGELWNLADR